jgi:hypothetical protein
VRFSRAKRKRSNQIKQDMTKSLIVTLIASSLVVLSGVSGKARTLWDIDILFKYVSSQTGPHTDSFDIKGKYDPALKTLTDAYASFLVWDNHWYDKGEEVAVDLEKKRFLCRSDASFNLLGRQISADALAKLATTGSLQYTIHAIEGDFLAVAAKLWVETCPKTVPDGGATLMLLCLTLAGIEPLRRRMARRNTQPRRV